MIVARAFGARLRTPRPASGRSRRVVPRHPCGGHRGRQVGHDLAGRAHAADGEPLGCRLACLHRQLPRLHGSHAGRARWQHPELVAAFEAAVRDGMDVINLSGGSAETDPPNDALVEATRNAAAGVVPVIAAGNSRDDFGFGTVGSPGSARRRSPLGPCPTHTCWAGRVGHRCRARRRTSSSSRSACRSRIPPSGTGRGPIRRSQTWARSRAPTGGRRPAALRRPEPGSPRLDPPTQLAAQHDRARLPRPLPADHEGVPRRGLRRRGRDRDGRQPRERGESPATRSRRAGRSGLRPRRRLPP